MPQGLFLPLGMNRKLYLLIDTDQADKYGRSGLQNNTFDEIQGKVELIIRDKGERL